MVIDHGQDGATLDAHTDWIGEHVSGVPDLLVEVTFAFHGQAGPDGEVRGVCPGWGPGVLGCRLREISACEEIRPVDDGRGRVRIRTPGTGGS